MGRRVGPRSLGAILHALSFLKLAFYLLGMFFQAKAMLVRGSGSFADDMNAMLLMYGIAMSFEGLRDNTAVGENQRRSYVRHPKLWRGTILATLGGAIMAIGIGFLVLFLERDATLGSAIAVFGLGMMALARQQLDQFEYVLALPGQETGGGNQPPDPGAPGEAANP